MRVQKLFWLMLFALICLSPAVHAKDLMEPDSEVAILDTSMGKISLEFFPNAAPKHVENFKTLARKGFYDGSKFHRVIKGFMIQGGDPKSKDNDPNNDGTGNAGYTLKAEFTKIPHKRGILSMARGGHSVDSASCQFFIMHKDYPSLDNQYSVFGRVIDGMDVVDAIANVPVGPRDNPIQPVIIKTVKIEKRSAQPAAANK
jgi:peptidyl-prolyl cis-trans isomerase B (cyclophilin B)